MKKISLDNVTLVGIDCVDIERLILAAEISKKYVNFGDVKLFSHLFYDWEGLVKIRPLKSVKEYSHFVVKELYKYINTTHVLIIQWDGFVLNPLSWDSEFFKYDYIGAPWLHNGKRLVGNGGFSFRSLNLLKFLAIDKNITEYHPEDFIICKNYGSYLEEHNFKFASKDLASRFSVESEVWNGQFGFHQTDISAWDSAKFTDHHWHIKLLETYVNLKARIIEVNEKR